MSEKEKKHWVKLPVKVTVVPPKVSTIPGSVWVSYQAAGEEISAHRYITHTEYGQAKGIREATEALTRDIARMLESAIRDRQHRYLITCGDGTMLLVECRNGSSCYTIIKPGQPEAGVSVLSGEPLAELLESAKHHATQSYGGVAHVVKLY